MFNSVKIYVSLHNNFHNNHVSRNIALENVIVEEIRGTLGRKKWTKAEIKGMYKVSYVYIYITCDVYAENEREFHCPGLQQ